MKLERAPKYISLQTLPLGIKYLKSDSGDIIQKELVKAQKKYLYWDKVKYLKLPKDLSNKEFWLILKEFRNLSSEAIIFGKHKFNYNTTIFLSSTLYDFDVKYGGSLSRKVQFSDIDQQQYLVSSVMEEAISSSQIEGASTTRKAAKQMLVEERAPRDKSELMILNNYRTIQRIKELKDEPLTEELLLEIHRLMTAGTLDNPNDEGSYRTNDDIQVIDSGDNEVVHVPPSFKELDQLMNDLYIFFNEEEHDFFIHPVVKACIIHFMIGYIHPFVDGNGRTARALFYWYMLKKGYWLTEYLSISSIILKHKVKYAKAFLYTETDDNDLTYFINYKMEVLESAYKSLMEYIKRKNKERKAASHFLKLGNINERQALVLQWLEEDPDRVIKIKEIENYFAIVNQTARRDLNDLVNQGYLVEQMINQKQKIFLKAKK
jgi:Fic family protein